MKSFTFAGYTQPLHATEVPEPALGESDVLIDVRSRRRRFRPGSSRSIWTRSLQRR